MKAFPDRALFGLAITLSMAAAQSAPAAEAPQPKLLVMVAVDQYSADLFNEYRPLYKEGLKQLATGVVFPRGHQSHASTETCPGHSTILTGARPSRTGIIANEWQTPKQAYEVNGQTTHEVYCAKDPATQAVTPKYLKVPTLGDRMHAANPKAKIAAVAGKDRAATMLAGHDKDTMTLWWNGKKFETYANGRLPKGIDAVNAAAEKSMRMDVPVDMHAACRSRVNAVTFESGVQIGVETPDETYSAWRASSAFDAAVLDAALLVLDEEELGRGEQTDLLAIGFSATDYVGHRYGAGGIEMCTQQLRLDALIGRLIDRLDHIGVPYVIALTADHGGVDVPERNKQQGAGEAKRLELDLYPAQMSKYVAEKLGIRGPAILGNFFTPDIYFSETIPKKLRARAIAIARERYEASDSVELVMSWEELNKAPAPAGMVDEWTLQQRARASFDPERSGSLVVLTKPFVTPLPPPTKTSRDYIAGHATPWGYDRRVPILFWWPGIKGFEQPIAVESVDIMPTLAGLIGLKIPEGDIDGHALDLSRAER